MLLCEQHAEQHVRSIRIGIRPVSMVSAKKAVIATLFGSIAVTLLVKWTVRACTVAIRAVLRPNLTLQTYVNMTMAATVLSFALERSGR